MKFKKKNVLKNPRVHYTLTTTKKRTQNTAVSVV